MTGRLTSNDLELAGFVLEFDESEHAPPGASPMDSIRVWTRRHENLFTIQAVEQRFADGRAEEFIVTAGYLMNGRNVDVSYKQAHAFSLARLQQFFEDAWAAMGFDYLPDEADAAAT